MKKIQTTDNQGNEIVSLAMTQFKTNDASKSCKDGRCITVSVAERNLRRQEKDNIALAGLSSRVSVYTVSGATLAYGYAHSTPAALKFAGEFMDNDAEANYIVELLKEQFKEL